MAKKPRRRLEETYCLNLTLFNIYHNNACYSCVRNCFAFKKMKILFALIQSPAIKGLDLKLCSWQRWLLLILFFKSEPLKQVDGNEYNIITKYNSKQRAHLFKNVYYILPPPNTIITSIYNNSIVSLLRRSS